MDKLDKFSLQARFLHWLSALVIIWASLSGFIILDKDITQQLKHSIADFNVAVTSILIPFFIWRILVRIHSKVPSYQNRVSSIEARLARYIHLIIYALVSLVLISGVLMMDRSINIFGYLQLPQLITDSSLLTSFKTIHKFSTRALAALVLFHILALVRHQLLGKQILQRML